MWHNNMAPNLRVRGGMMIIRRLIRQENVIIPGPTDAVDSAMQFMK